MNYPDELAGIAQSTVPISGKLTIPYPVPRDGNPVPRDKNPVPRDGNPVPRDENPVPRDENPFPRDEKFVSKWTIPAID